MGQRSEMPVSTDLDHPSDLVKKQQRILSNWKKLTAGLLKGRAKQTFARMQKENHETALQKLEQDSRTLRKRIFGIGPSNHSMPTSRLVYPLSPFGVSWLVLTAILLAYTAIVTPPVISFHWLDPPCVRVPTMEMDMFVDVFFLLDIILNFNMGRLGERSGGGGEYDDDRWSVSKRYLRGFFLFDLVTSIPVSFVELSTLQQCSSAGEQDRGSSDLDLRMVRALKPLRFMKVLRLMKLGKLGFVVDMLSDFFNISPKFGKTLKVGTVLISIIHILSCLWWLWKVSKCQPLGASSPSAQLSESNQNTHTHTHTLSLSLSLSLSHTHTHTQVIHQFAFQSARGTHPRRWMDTWARDFCSQNPGWTYKVGLLP